MRFLHPDADTPDGGSAEDQEFEDVVIHGESKRVSRGKLREAAQKWMAMGGSLQSDLDKAKAQIDKMSKDSDEMGAFIKDLKDWMEGDDNAGIRIGRAAGLSQDQMDRMLGNDPEPDADYEEEEEDEEEEEYTPPSRRTVRSAVKKMSLDELLDPDTKRDLEFVRKQRHERLRDTLFKELDSVLEQDAVVGKILSGNPKAAQMLKRLGQQTLQRRVTLEGGTPGPGLYGEVAKEIREFADGIGIRAEDKPADDKGLRALGIGPADDTLSDVLHQEQPPERVPVSSTSYRGNLFQRLARHIKDHGGLQDADQTPTAD